MFAVLFFLLVCVKTPNRKVAESRLCALQSTERSRIFPASPPGLCREVLHARLAGLVLPPCTPDSGFWKMEGGPGCQPLLGGGQLPQPARLF